MKIRISKAEVLKAIAEEPMLSPGFWLGDAELHGRYVDYKAITPLGLKAGDLKACRVCAVGAVFRRLLPADLEAKAAVTCVEDNISGRFNCVPDHEDIEEEIAAEEAKAEEDEYDDADVPSYLDRVADRARDILAADQPWNALSYMFEGLCHAHGLRDVYSSKVVRERAQAPVRSALTAFVTEEFPEDLTMEVADYSPRIPFKEFTT